MPICLLSRKKIAAGIRLSRQERILFDRAGYRTKEKVVGRDAQVHPFAISLSKSNQVRQVGLAFEIAMRLLALGLKHQIPDQSLDPREWYSFVGSSSHVLYKALFVTGLSPGFGKHRILSPVGSFARTKEKSSKSRKPAFQCTMSSEYYFKNHFFENLLDFT